METTLASARRADAVGRRAEPRGSRRWGRRGRPWPVSPSLGPKPACQSDGPGKLLRVFSNAVADPVGGAAEQRRREEEQPVVRTVARRPVGFPARVIRQEVQRLHSLLEAVSDHPRGDQLSGGVLGVLLII